MPGLPRDADGPVFGAPWQAHAFAMTVSLHERGVFKWCEWTNTLSEEIRSARQAMGTDCGEIYYLHWLQALERLVAAKGVTSNPELARYQRGWSHAAQRTIHGAPIVLSDDDLDD
jgi:nitrile hydratase accessory protein